MTTACVVQPRILIADDQRDLLDALHLLPTGEGIVMDAVVSATQQSQALGRAS